MPPAPGMWCTKLQKAESWTSATAIDDFLGLGLVLCLWVDVVVLVLGVVGDVVDCMNGLSVSRTRFLKPCRKGCYSVPS